MLVDNADGGLLTYRLVERNHEVLSITGPTGTPVRVAGGGRLAKLFNSKPGGITLPIRSTGAVRLLLRPPRQVGRWRQGRHAGQARRPARLCRWQRKCGPSVPHLRFAVVALTPEKQR